MTRITRRAVFQVQRQDGYTDGKPSWRTIIPGGRKTWSRESAEAAMVDLAARNPDGKYRVRKVWRR